MSQGVRRDNNAMHVRVLRLPLTNAVKSPGLGPTLQEIDMNEIQSAVVNSRGKYEVTALKIFPVVPVEVAHLTTSARPSSSQQGQLGQLRHELLPLKSERTPLSKRSPHESLDRGNC